MPEAYIYDHVRTPRGRGKADGALHEVTALALGDRAAEGAEGAQQPRRRTSSTTSSSAWSIRSARPAPTSRASRR